VDIGQNLKVLCGIIVISDFEIFATPMDEDEKNHYSSSYIL